MIIDHNFHVMIVVIIYEILVLMDEIFIHTFFMTPTYPKYATQQAQHVLYQMQKSDFFISNIIFGF